MKIFRSKTIVILTVKSYHTYEALKQMQSLINDETMILTLQNGIDNEDKIAEVYGEKRVISGVAYIASNLIAPGVIHHTALGRITIGNWKSNTNKRIEQLVQLFEKSGIPVKITDDIMEVKWKKLLWNASFNPMSVLVPVNADVLATMEETKEIIRRIMGEILAVAHTLGYSIQEEIIDRSIRWTAKFPNTQTSMLQDYLKGKPLELEALLGVILKKGKKLGIPTPTLEIVYTLVKAKEQIKSTSESNCIKSYF